MPKRPSREAAVRSSGGTRQRSGARTGRKLGLRSLLLLALSTVVFAGYMFQRMTSDAAETYSSIEDHLKYGSTGSERTIGIPKAVFLVLPKLFPEYLPGDGYASLGFVYEPGRSLPIGFSTRDYHGIDRVGMNCGACHVGRVRQDDQVRIYAGMPSNTVDVGAFERFLSRCATDAKFTPDRILAAIHAAGIELGLLERLQLRYVEIYRTREKLLELRQHLRFKEDQPQFGPGRVDTITATKSLFGIDLGNPYERPVGTVDFAAIWLQAPKRDMQLYWDGSNDSGGERHLLGALHSGALEAVDIESVTRLRSWLEDAPPPSYPYGFEQNLRQEGSQVFARYCADCHGRDGRDFEGDLVGRVTPLEEIGTDPQRVWVYTEEVAKAQMTVKVPGAGRLRRFSPTGGYANVPLDGLWLRAPYLHNGSVPTLAALLEPSSQRPDVFYRGGDLFDPEDVGFVSDQPEEDGRKLFRFYTGLPGNSNRGHEGERFGTELSRFQKAALIEYLKTF